MAAKNCLVGNLVTDKNTLKRECNPNAPHSYLLLLIALAAVIVAAVKLDIFFSTRCRKSRRIRISKDRAGPTRT